MRWPLPALARQQQSVALLLDVFQFLALCFDLLLESCVCRVRFGLLTEFRQFLSDALLLYDERRVLANLLTDLAAHLGVGVLQIDIAVGLLPEDFSAVDIDAEDVVGFRADEDAALNHNGRGIAPVGQRRLPGDVHLGADLLRGPAVRVVPGAVHPPSDSLTGCERWQCGKAQYNRPQQRRDRSRAKSSIHVFTPFIGFGHEGVPGEATCTCADIPIGPASNKGGPFGGPPRFGYRSSFITI